MAQNAQVRGDRTEVIADLKTAFEIEESVGEARLMYAAVLIGAGNDALADQVLAPIIASGGAADSRIAAAYVARRRFDKMIPIWEARAAVDTKNVQVFYTLAAAYYSVGNTSKAIEALERAKEADPSIAAQADSLIQQVRSGTATVQ